ncbi:glycosyltransferase [Kaistella sp. 97-N-M2]|uniref:glycosyltransferase n=1 Tax=Kaistella sp. 97-N-M2 TaxID=2908645 RepID=UPI001F18DF70|nr:glycosyltransferase [Kaistella sp. 97-N-M2]UJF28774.1 glycosyltransferase [Kaistella sp. 97-N-M2]
MHKKKDILFVMNNLNVGGAEKALISLLQIFDYEKYAVDLLLFKKEGLFLNQLPSEVTLLEAPKNLRYFDMPFLQILKENVLQGNWNVIYRRIQFKRQCKKAKNSAEAEQFGWKALSKTLNPLSKQYDAAIGFLEKNPNYFVVDHTLAAKKIGWIHNDYISLSLNKDIDHHFFKQLNHIVTVSAECVKSLENTFPQFKEKIKLIHNISSQEKLCVLSDEDIPLWVNQKFILTIGRLTEQKAIEKAIDAFEILQKTESELQWIVLGEGSLRPFLENKIKEKGFENKFHLLGNKPNPYPYLKRCTVYVQTSIFEGKSIAIDEAKLFAKPMVITNYPSAKDQIMDGVNGLLADLNAVSIAKKIKMLLDDKNMQNAFSQKLRSEETSYEKEIEKLYQLME